MLFRTVLICLYSFFYFCALHATSDTNTAKLWKPNAPVLIFMDRGITQKNHDLICFYLNSDEMIDHLVQPVFLDSGISGEIGPGAWLRRQYGLKSETEAPQLWILLGTDGFPINSGLGLPDPEKLAVSIESSLGPSEIKRQKQFLIRNPENLEAQRDLLFALRRRLEKRLKEQSLNRVEAIDLDTFLWGEFSREMNIFFQLDGWLFLRQPITALVPPGLVERSSPVMKSLYRKHLPRVMALLRRIPESSAGWVSLNHMLSVLGEYQVAPAANDFMPFASPFHNINIDLVFPAFGVMVARARQTGDWKPSLPLLQLLWEKGAKPSLTFSMVVGIGPGHRAPTQADLSRVKREDREMVWERVLAPLIEGYVRGAGGEGVTSLLESLDDSWAGMGLEARLMALARHLGRPEMAATWLNAVRSMPSPTPAQGMLTAGFHLFYQSQSQPPAEWEYAKGLAGRGINISLLEIREGLWLSRLGWKRGVPQWALLGPGGEPILGGEEIPDPEVLYARLRETGVKTELDWVIDSLQSNPDHLMTIAELGRIYRRQSHYLWSTREEPIGHENSKKEMSKPEASAWKGYFQCLEKLLGDPIGTCPELLQKYKPMPLVKSPPPELRRIIGKQGKGIAFSKDELPDDFGVRAMAGRLIRPIEAELWKRPSDQDLWDSWFSLASVLGTSPVELFSSLSPGPMAEVQGWPSTRVLRGICQELLCSERWSQLADLLASRWSLEKMRLEALTLKNTTPKKALDNKWDFSLTRLYLIALLELGRSVDADQILSEYLAAGEKVANIDDICLIAEALGLDSFKKKWTKEKLEIFR